MNSNNNDPILYADTEKRAGVFSDYMTVKNVNGKCILDFFMIDDVDENGLSANLASRVIMTRSGLLALRDMLNRHIDSMTTEEPSNE